MHESDNTIHRIGNRLSALEARLSRIEAARRRQRRLALLLGVLLVLIVAGAWDAAIQHVIRAREFVLVDEQGRERGGMRMTADGPWIGLKTPDGTPAVAMIVASNGPWVGLFDTVNGGRLAAAAAETQAAPETVVSAAEEPKAAPVADATASTNAASGTAPAEEPVVMDAIDRLFEALKMMETPAESR